MLNFDGTGYLLLTSRILNSFPCSMLVSGTRSNSSGDQYWLAQTTGSSNRAMYLSLDDSSEVKRGDAVSPSGSAMDANKATTPNVSATVAKWAVVNFYGVNDIGIMFGDTTEVRQTNGSLDGDFCNLHNTVCIGARFINGGPREFAKGALGEAHFYSGAYTPAMLTTLLAGTVKPEEQANWIDGFTLKDYQSSGNYVSIGGSRTMVASGGVTASGVTHLVSRTTPDTTAPTVTSATVANSTPTVVTLTMSEPMDTTNIPVASAFTVSGHTVSSVGISGSVISLTCSAAFVNGEAARTVAYTQPGTANARDSAGNLLANFTAQSITNNVAAPDTTAPTFSSALVANTAPADIVITMSETLAAFTPAASAFAVSGGKTVSSVARSGATITLTCSAAYSYGDSVTVTYTKPGTNMLQDAAGNQTASFGPLTVNNNIANPGGSVTFTPVCVLKAAADGTPAASVAIHAFVHDKTTGVLVGSKTGLTTNSTGLPPAFTASFGVAGTQYDVKFVDDSNPLRRSLEAITPT